METLAEQLRSALKHYGVHLGSEHLVQQPKLPHVVMIPVREALTAPTQAAHVLAGDAQQTINLVCRADTYEQARQLALLCWQLPDFQRTAELHYGTETWGTKTIRVARLVGTVPLRIARKDLTLARIAEVGVHVRQQPPTLPPEVNDDQAEGTVQLDFHEHGDPPHRFG